MSNCLYRNREIKQVCKNCGMQIPRYAGRYPSKCPSCGELLFAERVDYEKVIEGFSSGAFMLQEHKGSINDVRRDVLHGFVVEAILLDSRMINTYDVCFPTQRVITESRHSKLLDFCLSNVEQNGSIISELVSVAPDVILTEDHAKDIAQDLRCISSAPWVKYTGKVFSPARGKQLFCENYLFSRRFLSHEEAVEYANTTLLYEEFSAGRITHSSILAPKKPGDIKHQAGGFRFQIGTKNEKGKRRVELQRRILSKKNKSRGVASRVASAKQLLQRKAALEKAKNWHKSSSKAKRMHIALGRHLHKSAGLIRNTNESLSQLKHLSKTEAHERAFSNGSEYTSGEIYRFVFNGKPLLESQLSLGKKYRLLSGVRSTVYFSGGEGVYLEEGTLIEIVGKTPAGSWKGDYPNPPMGRFIYEVKPLSGEHANLETYEFDGSDLAIGLGLNEGIVLAKSNVPIKSFFINGTLYLSEDELVVSSYGYMLTEKHIGAITRAIPSIGNINIRVYNDDYDHRLLEREMLLSELNHWFPNAELKRISGCILVEQKEAIERIKIRYTEMINARREQLRSDISKLREVAILDIQKMRDRQKNDIARLKEGVSAGGSGTVINKPIKAVGVNGEVITLPVGTEINRRGETREILVLSGEHLGRRLHIVNESRRSIDVNKIIDLQRELGWEL
jgi:hypothetical protein